MSYIVKYLLICIYLKAFTLFCGMYYQKEMITMPKNAKQTSPKVAKEASQILRSKTSTKTEKSVAASDLAQARKKK